MLVRLVIAKLPQLVVNTKLRNFPLMYIVLPLLKVLINALIGITVDNKTLKIFFPLSAYFLFGLSTPKREHYEIRSNLFFEYVEIVFFKELLFINENEMKNFFRVFQKHVVFFGFFFFQKKFRE